MAQTIFDAIDAEIAAVEARILTARLRLSQLRAARAVLCEISPNAPPQTPRVAQEPGYSRRTLVNHIQEELRTGGSCERDKLRERLLENGVTTTRAALATTLTRLKGRGLVSNASGVWRLVV